MQRVRLKAERNIGFCATVSARALNVEGTSFAVIFHQPGMEGVRCISATTVRITRFKSGKTIVVIL